VAADFISRRALAPVFDGNQKSAARFTELTDAMQTGSPMSQKSLMAMFRPLVAFCCMVPVHDSAVLGQSSAASSDAAVENLFDGKTLDGWEGDPEHWRVDNGVIVGEILPGQTLNRNTWLVWRGGTLADFDLRLQFRLKGLPAANSGIQFRCQVENVDHVSGYQADLDMGATWLGRIYDEHGRALLVERGSRVQFLPNGTRKVETFAPPNQYAVLFRENDWNDYRIVAVGDYVAVYVNGTLFSELQDQQIAERGSETVAQMSVPPGFSVDVIAAAPALHQPMAFTFDAKGHLWVVEGRSYPQKRPVGEGLDRILIFADNNHDGTFETRTVFIEGLNLVSGMEVGHEGVWVGAAPELLFIPDRNGDDQPDSQPQVLLDGFGFADTHETLNSFMRGLNYDDVGQIFMTHCRSFWGKGPTTHVMQGGHYWNQVNSGHAPFISTRSISARAWTVQLAVESFVPARVAEQWVDLCRRDDLLFVRRYLASAIQRVPAEVGWKIAEVLCSRIDSGTDRDLPLLVWYGVAPLVLKDLDRIVQVFDGAVNVRWRSGILHRLGQAAGKPHRSIMCMPRWW